jgi:ABC-type dipeptide/oligopeptide/nickel transport system permease component
MTRYLLLRLARFALTVWVVSTVAFLVTHAIGDPARLLVNPEGTQQDLAGMKAALGLDRPLPDQYLAFLAGIPRGDFGTSFRYSQPAMPLVLGRLPATLLLAGTAFLVMVPLGLVLGTAAAVRRNSPIDYLATSVAVAGRAMPSFWLGLVLILLFSVGLKMLPPSGMGGPQHLLMPAAVLGTATLATVTRLTRSSLLEVLSQDYIRTAHSKGISNRRVLIIHALRNSMLPLVSVLAIEIGGILTGAVIVETIFAWPGVGRLIVESIFAYDFPVVQASVFLTAFLFAFVNLCADLMYGILDPRIRLNAGQ